MQVATIFYILLPNQLYHGNLHTIVPGVVQNLVCAKPISSNKLTFSWELPIAHWNEVFGYRVEIKGLQHRNGTREIVQFDISGFNTARNEVTINQRLSI